LKICIIPTKHFNPSKTDQNTRVCNLEWGVPVEISAQLQPSIVNFGLVPKEKVYAFEN
jgi:hypothetical protein